jgi:hypothetical protein
VSRAALAGRSTRSGLRRQRAFPPADPSRGRTGGLVFPPAHSQGSRKRRLTRRCS